MHGVRVGLLGARLGAQGWRCGAEARAERDTPTRAVLTRCLTVVQDNFDIQSFFHLHDLNRDKVLDVNELESIYGQSARAPLGSP